MWLLVITRLRKGMHIQVPSKHQKKNGELHQHTSLRHDEASNEWMVSALHSDLIRSDFRAPRIRFLTRIVTSCQRHGTAMPSGFLKLRIFWFKSLPGVLPATRESAARGISLSPVWFFWFFLVWKSVSLYLAFSGLLQDYLFEQHLVWYLVVASFFQPNLWVARNWRN